MEMHTVASNNPGLTTMREFCVTNFSTQTFTGLPSQHQMGAVLFLKRVLITPHADIPV